MGVQSLWNSIIIGCTKFAKVQRYRVRTKYAYILIAILWYLSLAVHCILKFGLSPSKEICFICFNKSLLKLVKNAFHFILKALVIFKIFKFLSWLTGHVEKRLDWKDKVNFKIYDAKTWLINDYNAHIGQYPTK